MTRYRLDPAKLKIAVQQAGFRHATALTAAHKINRATLNNYLKGRGPFPESYYKICDALKADPLELLSPVASRQDLPHLEELGPLLQAVTRRDPNLAVGLLGSRASGKAKKYSDWDLGLTRGSDSLSTKDYLRLKQIVSDLAENLPRSVDLVNLDGAPAWFLKDLDYEPIFLAGNEISWAHFLGVLHGSQKAA